MGMSTHVVGFRPPDEKWQKMKAIWDACNMALVDPPSEVYDFFEGMAPDPSGVVVELQGYGETCVREWSDASSQGFEVTIADLPKDVGVIRFYNSW